MFIIFHRIPATYETASLRKFWHGRTETLRVCTSEMVEFTKTMLDPSASVSFESITFYFNNIYCNYINMYAKVKHIGNK